MILLCASQLFPSPLKSEDEWEDGIFVGERISSKWKRGRHLIYDCIDQAFICVDQEGFQNCQSDRDLYRTLDSLRPVDSFCAPLKKFEKSPDCFLEQDRQITRYQKKIFCDRRELLRLQSEQKEKNLQLKRKALEANIH